MRRSLNIRWQLTLWYGAAMTLALVVFGTAVFLLTVRSQLARIDFELQEEMSEFAFHVSTVDDLET